MIQLTKRNRLRMEKICGGLRNQNREDLVINSKEIKFNTTIIKLNSPREHCIVEINKFNIDETPNFFKRYSNIFPPS